MKSLLRSTVTMASVMTAMAPASFTQPRPVRTTSGSTTLWSPTCTRFSIRQAATSDVRMNPHLRLAALWHADDVLNNRALDGDIGSDGSTT